MTPQEAFNKIWTHSAQMTERSSNFEYLCAYRGTNNTKCFIGALIPDSEYDYSRMENKPVNWLVNELKLPSLAGLSVGWLRELQDIHDLHFYAREQLLRKFAEKHNLTIPEQAQ